LGQDASGRVVRDTSSSFALRKLRAAQKVISVRVRLRSRASSRQSLGNRAARSMARLGRDQGKWGEGRDLLAPISGWSTRLRYARSEGGEGIARQSGDVSCAVMDVCMGFLRFLATFHSLRRKSSAALRNLAQKQFCSKRCLDKYKSQTGREASRFQTVD